MAYLVHMTLTDLWQHHEGEEKGLVRAALETERWSLRGAARRLGIAPSTLQYLLETRLKEIGQLRRQNVKAA